MKKLSIYLHVPFCVKKCLYCDFLSFNAENELIFAYFDALFKEIEQSKTIYKDYAVTSIFFGGGTPSYVEAGLIVKTLEKLKSSFNIDENAEISIEVNPASAMLNKLILYKEAGINRISIGAQSLNDDELIILGRAHDSLMFFETYDNARKAGFKNINVDIMSSLPSQTTDSYTGTLNEVLKLRPEHISAYSLIVEENTPFYDMELNLPTEETDRDMYHETKRILADKGYHRYEISNYALGEEYECCHNKVYWKRGNYLGLGLGAASMVDNIRWNNTRDVKRYIETMSGFQDLVSIRENVERLDIQAQMEEYMFLGLRLTKGVSINKFKELFGQEIFSVYGEVIDKYQQMGLLKQYNQDGKGLYLRLTDTGLDVSNTVMADFLF